MAVTKILAKSMRLDKLVNYVANGDKTESGILVTTRGCRIESAAQQMMDTKERWGKTDGVQAYHIIQSFKPGEITPELAHELGCRLADEFLPGYEVCIGTHTDKEHIHNHIVFNSVSLATGKKYTNTRTDYYKGIRRISDALCAEYGLSLVMETGGKGLSYAEWKLKQAGLLSNKELLMQDVADSLSLALDIGNFYELMEQRGYTVCHHSKYPSFIPYGCEHPMCAYADGKQLTEDDLRALLDRSYASPESAVLMPRQRTPYIPRGKQKGFRALYVSWMYVLGLIGKGARSPYTKIDYAEVKRFEQYQKQAAFIEENRIDTPEQLAEKERALSARLDELTKTRIILNSKKKNRRSLYDAAAALEYLSDVPALYEEGVSGVGEDYAAYKAAAATLQGENVPALREEKASLYTRIADVNAEMREVRKQLHLCEAVKADAPDMERRLTDESGRRMTEIERDDR